jgi:hypothetical protein
MKYTHTFESFLNENLNEAKLPTTIPELEKALIKAADINEYLKKWESYSSQFRRYYPYANLVTDFVPNANMEDIILSQGKYVSDEKKRSEEGYGGYSRPVEAKAAYEKLVNDREWEQLIILTIRSTSKEQFFKKLATYFKKQLSPLLLAQKILYSVWKKAGDSYDRNLTMNYYFADLCTPLWDNQKDVYNTVGRGSFGRNITDSQFRDYLLSLEKIVRN